ncbi:MAG: hypothetical protein GX183_03835 [Firmicutes bacterium]|nr:hypothetical protein [Bacillota bacterium]
MDHINSIRRLTACAALLTLSLSTATLPQAYIFAYYIARIPTKHEVVSQSRAQVAGRQAMPQCR